MIRAMDQPIAKDYRLTSVLAAIWITYGSVLVFVLFTYLSLNDATSDRYFYYEGTFHTGYSWLMKCLLLTFGYGLVGLIPASVLSFVAWSFLRSRSV
jgi:hypothetical protein